MICFILTQAYLGPSVACEDLNKDQESLCMETVSNRQHDKQLFHITSWYSVIQIPISVKYILT